MTEESQYQPLNVFGESLTACCFTPLTGFFRDGYCHTGPHDLGSHTVCARLTDEFLAFTLRQGNDLISPRPEFDFPGLKAGDYWCLCVLRWKQAEAAGVAPPVKLDACQQASLKFVSLELLEKYALPASEEDP